MEQHIFFDIETTGLSAWYGDKITCICAKFVDQNNNSETFSVCGNNEEEIINSFLEFLNRYKDASFVTKNGLGFDIPFFLTRQVLNSSMYSEDLIHRKHFDIQTITKKWISLDDFSRILNCESKSSNGYEAMKMFKEHRFEELKNYCMNDVEVTQEVYNKIMKLWENKK